MNRLPPISRDSSPVTAKIRRSSSPASSSGLRQTTTWVPSPEYQRNQSHQRFGNFPPTEIRVTDEGDSDDAADNLQSVRGVMGSPVPRSLTEDVLGMDQSVWVSRHSSHPKITIDMCYDLQKGQQKSVNRGPNVGSPIIRSVSENTLLAAPKIKRHAKLYAAKSCNELNTDFGRKLSVSSSRSEGNINLLLNEQKCLASRFPFDGLNTESAPSSSRRRSGVRTERGLPLTRTYKSRSVSTDRSVLDRQSFCGSSTDSGSRPSSPLPDGGLGSPHWSTVGSPPTSPRLSPCSSPVSTSLLSTNVLEGHFQMPGNSSTSSIRGSRSVPTSPNRTFLNSGSSVGKTGSSPRASIRLLPLRGDRQEV